MDVVLRAALMYVVVLVMLRVTTKRIIKSATPLDLAIIFLLGGLAVPCVLGGDQSVTGALLAIATIAGMHFGLSALRMRWPVVGRIVEGTPVVVYHDDRWDERQMTFARVTKADVLAEVRQNGLTAIDDVQTVIIEHNGGITVLPRKDDGTA